MKLQVGSTYRIDGRPMRVTGMVTDQYSGQDMPIARPITSDGNERRVTPSQCRSAELYVEPERK